MQTTITTLVEHFLKTMSNPEKIPIYIADAEAEKFLLFQQHYETFALLLDNGVFDVRNGSVTIHFDNKGILKAINRSDVLYSSRHT
jgi:hypothetical protein